MSKTFVIAGNHDHARIWIKEDVDKRYRAGETSITLSDYIYVSGPEQLRGYSDPHGVFIGNWYERKDIREILTILHMSGNKVNTQILKALQVYGEYVNENK